MAQKDKEVNHDELVGYIMRRGNENGTVLNYAQVNRVLDLEMQFLKEKGIVSED